MCDGEIPYFRHNKRTHEYLIRGYHGQYVNSHMFEDLQNVVAPPTIVITMGDNVFSCLTRASATRTIFFREFMIHGNYVNVS